LDQAKKEKEEKDNRQSTLSVYRNINPKEKPSSSEHFPNLYLRVRKARHKLQKKHVRQGVVRFANSNYFLQLCSLSKSNN
jgi:hypothetical protein